MTLAALVLLLAVPRSGPVPQTGDAQKAATSAVSTETSSADDSGAKPASATASASVSDTPVVPAATNESLSASNLLPSMPEPKSAPSAAAGVPAAFPVAPVKAPVVVYSATAALCSFQRAVRGDASQPRADGLSRQADDDEPPRDVPQTMVAAANGWRGPFVRCRLAQRRAHAIAEFRL